MATRKRAAKAEADPAPEDGTSDAAGDAQAGDQPPFPVTLVSSVDDLIQQAQEETG